MAIEIEQVKEQVQEQIVTIAETKVEDGWSKAFDDIIAMDFSGFNTLIAVIIFLVLLKPILFIARFAIIGFVLFWAVKYFLYYA
jgi:hypothetical protein